MLNILRFIDRIFIICILYIHRQLEIKCGFSAQIKEYNKHFFYIQHFLICITHSRSKNKKINKKRNTLINSNANYRREMKLIPIKMYYCLLKFVASQFLLGGLYLTWGSLPNFNFSM